MIYDINITFCTSHGKQRNKVVKCHVLFKQVTRMKYSLCNNADTVKTNGVSGDGHGGNICTKDSGLLEHLIF